MARPTKLDEDTIAKLLAALQRGVSKVLACKIAQIDYSTFWRHYKKDKGFARKVDSVEAQVVLAAADAVYEAVKNKKDASVALKVLERKDPEGWRERDEEDNEPVTININFVKAPV